MTDDRRLIAYPVFNTDAGGKSGVLVVVAQPTHERFGVALSATEARVLGSSLLQAAESAESWDGIPKSNRLIGSSLLEEKNDQT